MSSVGLDSSVLLGYYQSQLANNPSALSAANALSATAAAQKKNSATANDVTPWSVPNTDANSMTAKVLSTTNFLDTSNVPKTAGATADSKTEQDNQKLFSLYSAVNTLAYLAKLAQDPTKTAGQLAGLDTRFQTGLSQIQSYLGSTDFNNFILQSAKPAASVTSLASVAFSNYSYKTQTLTSNANLNNALPGVSASDSFTIAVKKAGVTTNIDIDMSQVPGPLSLGNIITYINGQLSAGGFTTRFQKTQNGGTTTSDAKATYGMQITPGANEGISFSAVAKPALYMVGNSGSAAETSTSTTAKDGSAGSTTTAADQSGRLTKIGNLDGTPTAILSSTQKSTTGTTTAAATQVDASGNIYVLGNATGNFSNQLNQGAQDVYLTKYDSAGNVAWQHLVGSAGTATGTGLALDPSGGVVITGSTTADVVPGSVTNGNLDSFVARYDSSGNQTWIKQIPTLATNQSNSVSVDASGNIYIGGSVSGGVIGAGQTALGKGDAYLAKFDSKGKLLSENQFGTAGADSVSATATGDDGSLYVASVQNGEAVLAKYAGGDINSAPLWTQNLGAVQSGGGLSGLTVSGDQIYVSGTSSNANMTAGGQASVANASSGGIDAFVLNLTDNGASATANHVTYVGTSASDQGGAVTVGDDGTVYFTGSTMGTFAGQQRNIQNVSNAFATAINSDGSIAWTRQYGGASGQSTGAGLAVDTNGASVLDALGLPRGAINLNQSVELTNQTTLRAGSTFKIKIDGTLPRTTTITIDKGETLSSLVTKINGQLGGVGKAVVNYTGGAANLKITVNAGKTIDLISGDKDNDALSRLGIAAGTLSAPADGATATTTSDDGTSLPTYGLGLTGGVGGAMNLSSRTGANFARSQLLGVLSALQSTYQKSTAAPAAAALPGNRTGKASPDSAAQLANYSLALSLLGG